MGSKKIEQSNTLLHTQRATEGKMSKRTSIYTLGESKGSQGKEVQGV